MQIVRFGLGKSARLGWPAAVVLGAAALSAGMLFESVGSSSFVSRGQVASSQPGHLVGRAAVIDGDTVEIKGRRIRLHGIDAPESRQTCQDAKGHAWRCGAVAANALDQFIAVSRPLRCDLVDRDRFGRFVGNCTRADGADVAAWLVFNGHALDWPRYSKGAYAAQQKSARAEKAGIWSGTFETPWDWRARNRSASHSTSVTP